MRKHSEFLKKLETAHRAVKPKRGSAPAPAAAQPAPAPAAVPLQPAPPLTAAEQEIEIDNVAEQIGNAVEMLTSEDNTVPEAVSAPVAESIPAIETPPPSLFEDEDDAMKLYSVEEEEEVTSPRPKFDFDDLKFGANFDTDE
jgi:hypothetical protein